MSTHIVDRIEAIRFPAEFTGHYDDQFIVVHLGGDNNCIDSFTRKRARHWYPTIMGDHTSVIREACEWGAGCEGGCYRLHGRRTTPEGFIRAYRNAMKQAAEGHAGAHAKGLHLTLRIRFTEASKAEGTNSGYQWKRLMEAGKTATQAGDYSIVHFDPTSGPDMKLYFESCHAGGHNNAEVDGPGER